MRIFVSLAALAVVILPFNIALGQTPTLGVLVQQLQVHPENQELREQVIVIASAQHPAPSIPEEAHRAFVQGVAIAQAANDPNGERLAIERYDAALTLAPWWGDAYFNRAIAQDLAGDYDAAKTSLQLFLLTRPGARDAQAARDRTYAIEGRQQLAAQSQAQERTQAVDRLWASLEGAQYTCPVTAAFGANSQITAQIVNRMLVENMRNFDGVHADLNIPLPPKAATEVRDTSVVFGQIHGVDTPVQIVDVSATMFHTAIILGGRTDTLIALACPRN